ACGGTTTIIPFAAQHRGDSLLDVVSEYHESAKGKAVIDYAFHLIISDPTPAVIGEQLPQLMAEGCTSFKIYMTYEALKLDDRQILEVLASARKLGAMVMVHAENHDVIAYLTDKLLAEGKGDPRFHAVAHSAPAEREATHRAITFAEVVDVPMLIVHVSGGEAIEQIREAHKRGLRIYGETCPQYLFLCADDLDRPAFEGAKYMCSPPPRDRANQELVWRALESGAFKVFSSDHAPYRFDDPKGKKEHGEGASFEKVANGVPGLEIRMPMLFSEGVRKGRLSLEQFVSLTSTNAAWLYGLYPRKGTIAVGADADLAIWDPEREVTITSEAMHDNMDYTPYEGRRVTGWPVTTICRGEVVQEDGEIKASKGHGVFLPCQRPRAARPRDSSQDV
ncbi:MAG: dihydropyrimidinase, partial [Planctomycetota bacterium]